MPCTSPAARRRLAGGSWLEHAVDLRALFADGYVLSSHRDDAAQVKLPGPRYGFRDDQIADRDRLQRGRTRIRHHDVAANDRRLHAARRNSVARVAEYLLAV